MTLLAVIPERLWTKEAKDEVIVFLRELPAPARRRKQALVDWTKYVGVALTREMVEAVLGPLAERIR